MILTITATATQRLELSARCCELEGKAYISAAALSMPGRSPNLKPWWKGERERGRGKREAGRYGGGTAGWVAGTP